MKKTIITVVGNDTVGLIAKVCTYLAQNQVNILDSPGQLTFIKNVVRRRQFHYT